MVKVPDDSSNKLLSCSIDTIQIKPHLTLRICLSLHAKPYDPLGYILPTKVIGNLLFRETLQTLKKERQGHIPWDDPIDQSLVSFKSDKKIHDSWIKYFEMLLVVHEVKLKRCIKPENVDPAIDPDLVTFGDGNPDCFGVVAYVIFTLLDGRRSCSLLMSKSRLGPLDLLGETSRNELSSGVMSVRVKIFLMQESGLTFRQHFHFVDSMIVMAMIRKESYGFRTFAGLRVAEIQQKSNVEDWFHVPSNQNIADILTKGHLQIS